MERRAAVRHRSWKARRLAYQLQEDIAEDLVVAPVANTSMEALHEGDVEAACACRITVNNSWRTLPRDRGAAYLRSVSTLEKMAEMDLLASMPVLRSGLMYPCIGIMRMDRRKGGRKGRYRQTKAGRTDDSGARSTATRAPKEDCCTTNDRDASEQAVVSNEPLAVSSTIKDAVLACIGEGRAWLE